MTGLGAAQEGSGGAERVSGGQGVNEALRNDSRTWTLTIPAPAAWINSNDRLHRMAQAKLIKTWRLAASLAARNAGLPKDLARVHIIATITKPTRRKYDCGNLYPSVKPCIDGIVGDYGLLPDDDNEHLLGPDLRHNPTPGPASITLTIKEIHNEHRPTRV